MKAPAAKGNETAVTGVVSAAAPGTAARAPGSTTPSGRPSGPQTTTDFVPAAPRRRASRTVPVEGTPAAGVDNAAALTSGSRPRKVPCWMEADAPIQRNPPTRIV